MIRIARKTSKNQSEVLTEAVKYFGNEGLGLDNTEGGAAFAHFEGGGGFVTVEAVPDGENTEVEIVAREWEHDVKQFLARL
jgi:hypothetical protein